MFKTKKRRIKEECWNLDYELIKWLNEHLGTYLEDSEKIVDLDYFKYKYKGREYTFRECIEMLLEDTAFLLDSDVYSNREAEHKYTELDMKKYARELDYKKNQMYDLLKLIHWQLWW